MSGSLTAEFRDGEPLLPQQKVGDMVPLRMVHPWGPKDMFQVRLLIHDQELCISPTVRERDLALQLARAWFNEEAARLLKMGSAL